MCHTENQSTVYPEYSFSKKDRHNLGLGAGQFSILCWICGLEFVSAGCGLGLCFMLALTAPHFRDICWLHF